MLQFRDKQTQTMVHALNIMRFTTEVESAV